jgi:hypothetical protein
MLIPEKVVRQPAMYPQAIVSHRLRVSREHWRGNKAGKNGYHAQRFDHGHLSPPSGEAPRINNHVLRY